MIPVLEHDVDGDGPQMFEEPVCCSASGDGLAPYQHGQPGGGMDHHHHYHATGRTVTE